MEHVTEAGPTAPRGIFGDDTSLFLIGSVGVGLVIVEGPTPELQFTEDERTKVVAECQEGLGWLASREPRAGVSFAWDSPRGYRLGPAITLMIPMVVRPGGGVVTTSDSVGDGSPADGGR